jgi:predicted nucleic-acid-binding protein
LIGLDTNVLARYFVADAGADTATESQRQAARQLIESGQPLFLPKTVALELEWVLRGYYGFAAPQVLAVFDVLLGHPSLTLEDRPAVVLAVAGPRAGLAFADLITHKPPQPSTPVLGRVCNSKPHWQFDLSSLSSQNAC